MPVNVVVRAAHELDLRPMTRDPIGCDAYAPAANVGETDVACGQGAISEHDCPTKANRPAASDDVHSLSLTGITPAVPHRGTIVPRRTS